MAEAFRATEKIAAPADAVWAVLTDWDRATEWMGGIDALRAEGPNEVGTTLTFTARGKERSSRIVALEPGRSVTLRSEQGKATADYRYRCTPSDGEGADGTTVELVADCRTEGAVMAVAGPLLRMMMKRTDGSQLEALKRIVEATS